MEEERVHELTDRYIQREPYAPPLQEGDPLFFLLILPVLPFYLLFRALGSMQVQQVQQPRMKITQVFRDQEGRIKELSTYYE